ncbi:allophanate hydrolase subunit 1 [Rhodococcus jostii]|uniref:5-oxoprolinase subunit B family protein n=1 Tax=Rhodococcus jostii TaxID=132919 RepID=UPI00365164E7
MSEFSSTSTLFETRYSAGAEEFVLVEFDEEMSLETNLLVQRVVTDVESSGIDGVLDVCPANVSYLVRYDPDVISYTVLVNDLKKAEARSRAKGFASFDTRIVDIPVLFNDPWTHEVLMKFRDRVQDPDSTDLEYLSRVNGFADTEGFIESLTSTPSLASMTGFVPGIVWSYQMVPKKRQLQGPKYLRPRTETPDRAFALGGAFPAIYPTPSVGGYPIFGRAAAPVYDPDQRLPDFRDRTELVQLGTICNYRPIARDEYDEIGRAVSNGTYRYLIKHIRFEPAELIADPDKYNRNLIEVLYK